MNIKEFTIRKQGSKWQVVGHDGHVFGTHDTEEEAKNQLSAIYANKKKEILFMNLFKHLKEAAYSEKNVITMLSNAFEYMLDSKYEPVIRKQLLSPNSTEAAKLLRKPEVRTKVFSTLAGRLLALVVESMMETFQRRYRMEASEVKKHLTLNTILSQMGTGWPTEVTPSAPKAKSSTKESEQEFAKFSAAIDRELEEEMDVFDPEEENWLQTQLDRIEKENAEDSLPDAPTDKEKDSALKPVDSREQQEEAN